MILLRILVLLMPTRMKNEAIDNPFSTLKYTGPEHFCDREEELERMISNFRNDRPLTIFSKRRMGKTGLIKQFHHFLQKEGVICVYLDTLNTYSDIEFTNRLISKVATAINRSKSDFLEGILSTFSRFRPRFSVDQYTGVPTVEIQLSHEREIEHSLFSMFQLMKDEKVQFQIAIDEFQQIGMYDKTTIDASLRVHMQQIDNCHFIFSGSQRHLLLDLFNNPQKPFFRMVDQMMLEEIPYPSYFDFIKREFNNADKEISDLLIHQVLTWTQRHTFYTQVICNKLFAATQVKAEERDLQEIKNRTLKELQMNFLSFKNLLTKNQWITLRGIAKEGMVTSVRKNSFTSTYKIAPSTANQSLEFLVDKELVYEHLTPKGSEYVVYDLFFQRWIEQFT